MGNAVAKTNKNPTMKFFIVLLFNPVLNLQNSLIASYDQNQDQGREANFAAFREHFFHPDEELTDRFANRR